MGYPYLTRILGQQVNPRTKNYENNPELLYEFEKEVYSDIQITNKDPGRYVNDFHRTGFAYSRIPTRVGIYLDKFGEPDWTYTIWDGKSSSHTLHAIYFQKGKDMIQIWNRGNILSEYPWKMFEKQAHLEGYQIKSFHKGTIQPSHGYWLNK